MLETANILRKATSKSFVIIDELGRGTAPIEGSVISFACLTHLYKVNKSRTLFATHFHDVAGWTLLYKNVGYYCTDVQEHEDGGFTYVHKLRKGVNSNSHALIVARLAGESSNRLTYHSYQLTDSVTKSRHSRKDNRNGRGAYTTNKGLRILLHA